MNDGPSEPRAGSGRWSLPSWRRLGDFLWTIVQLERSYEALKAENTALKTRVAECEKLFADHGGQLKLLTAFVQDSLRGHVEMTAERTVARYVEWLIEKRSLPPGEGR